MQRFPRHSAIVLAALVSVALTACGPHQLEAEQCREDYLHLPNRERMAREPNSAEVRAAAAADMQQWVVDHPECRP